MKYLKGFLNLLLMIVTIIIVFFPISVFVHEGTHYITYSVEGIEVTSFHVLDHESLKSGWFGYVTISKDSRYGLLFQELVAYSVQSLFILTTVLFCVIKPYKSFTVHQLDLMGVKRKFRNATNIY